MQQYAFILISFIVLFKPVVAQKNTDNPEQLGLRITSLEQFNSKLNQQLIISNSRIQDLETKILLATDSIVALEKSLIGLENNLKDISSQLGIKIKESKDLTDGKINNLNEDIDKNTLYWIIAFLLASGFSAVAFVVLKKQFKKDKIDITEHIKQTSEVIREEQLKLDDQLLKLLESQMKLITEESSLSKSKQEEVDHTFTLKMADEIVRIQINLTHMEPDTRGLKQLSAAVKRIQDNLEANGYQIVEMLSKPYHEGMNVIANFRSDENLEKGVQIITRIIKPQVNFKGIMIQCAQIEVSCGEE